MPPPKRGLDPIPWFLVGYRHYCITGGRKEDTLWPHGFVQNIAEGNISLIFKLNRKLKLCDIRREIKKKTAWGTAEEVALCVLLAQINTPSRRVLLLPFI